MNIRKRGVRVQLLRGTKVDGKLTHKLLGSFSILCRSYADLEDSLTSVLTKREQGHLEEWIERESEKNNEKPLRRRVIPIERDVQLAKFKTACKDMISHGLTAELTESTLLAAIKITDVVDLVDLLADVELDLDIDGPDDPTVLVNDLETVTVSDVIDFLLGEHS